MSTTLIPRSPIPLRLVGNGEMDVLHLVSQPDENTLPEAPYAGYMDQVNNSRNLVFSGYFGADIPDRALEKTVMYKLALNKERVLKLRRELSNYTRARSLQGKWIPRCWGLFTGIYKGEEAACLVLEEVRESDGRKDPDFKTQICKALVKLHLHCDLQLNKNFVKPKGDPRLVVRNFMEDHVVNAGGKPVIHGLSNAVAHQCNRYFCEELQFYLMQLCE